jgi:hypothetical protein
MGFAVQWGTVRMLGTFLGENPAGDSNPRRAYPSFQLQIDPAKR